MKAAAIAAESWLCSANIHGTAGDRWGPGGGGGRGGVLWSTSITSPGCPWTLSGGGGFHPGVFPSSAAERLLLLVFIWLLPSKKML